MGDLSLTLGLLFIWIAEMVQTWRYKPLDVFLYDLGYIPTGKKGVWVKRPDRP